MWSKIGLLAVLLVAMVGCSQDEPATQNSPDGTPFADAGGDIDGPDLVDDAQGQGDAMAEDEPEEPGDGFPSVDQLPANPQLPDLLTMLDGTPVTSPQQWTTQRRPEVLRIMEHYAFGQTPPGPYELEAEVVGEFDDALGGKATMKLLTLNVGPGAALPVDVLLVVPNGLDGPAPVFMGLNFFGNHTTIDDPRVPLARGWVPERGEGVEGNRATEASRGTVSDRWPFEAIVDAGYALATVYHGDIDPDFADFGNGIHALYGEPEGDRDKQAWGTIAGWAWGVSRVVDHLVTEPGLDAGRIAVVGHSRNGKVALWAAAQDERIAMAISNMSGCMGAAINRRREGETIGIMNLAFPHWFASELHDFGRQEDKLPFDQHFLTALVAPRPVLINSGVDDHWADPEGEFLGAAEAGPVYELLGQGSMATQQWPGVGELVESPLGYHMQNGGHALNLEGWLAFIRFADLHL